MAAPCLCLFAQIGVFVEVGVVEALRHSRSIPSEDSLWTQQRLIAQAQGLDPAMAVERKLLIVETMAVVLLVEGYYSVVRVWAVQWSMSCCLAYAGLL
jgi:hypothetical protein